LIIQKLSLTNFRNYTTAEVEFHPYFNLIVGKNGMGKTNLVDAIHYLALSKSNFSSGEQYVMMQDAEIMRLQGNFIDAKENQPIIITARVKRKSLKVFSKGDKDYERLSQHIGLIPLVIISPKDILLILEGSSERRKFLDKSLIQCDPVYLSQLSRYSKLIKLRNAYLKSTQKTGYSQSYLESIDVQLPAPAKYIFEARKAFVKELGQIFISLYKQISGAQEHMDIEYRSSLEDVSMEETLKLNRDKDLILGRTTSGVHKDDIVFKMNGEVMKYFASQGQQKSLIYGLKLSQYQFLKSHNKHLPILILDDVFDKLDPLRVQQLIQLLNIEEFGQCFLTDTDESRLSEIMNHLNLDFVKFTVDNANIVIEED
jgi:DNA replication and repair protein RecF